MVVMVMVVMMMVVMMMVVMMVMVVVMVGMMVVVMMIDSGVLEFTPGSRAVHRQKTYTWQSTH